MGVDFNVVFIVVAAVNTVDGSVGFGMGIAVALTVVVSPESLVEFRDLPLSSDIDIAIDTVLVEMSGISVGSSGAIAKLRSVLRIPAKHGIIMAPLNAARIISKRPAIVDAMMI